MPDKAPATETAQDREKQAAVVVGQPQRPAAGADTLWAISNRRDDRVVLYERDPQHPGGEAFIGGSGPDHIAKTGAVIGLMRAGLIVEIPEPPEGPKKPIPTEPAWDAHPAAAPGQPIPLGREIDPELIPDAAAREKIAAKQAELPGQVDVPAGVIMPPPATESARGPAGR